MIFPPIEQYFGLKEEQVPLIIIQNSDGEKFFKPNIEPDQIASWVKDFKVMFSSLFGLLSIFLLSRELRSLLIKNKYIRLYLFSLTRYMLLSY